MHQQNYNILKCIVYFQQQRGHMRKFLLILSCFIAGTCGIERSFATSHEILPAQDISISEMMKIQKQEKEAGYEELLRIDKSLQKNLNNSENFLQLEKICEDYILNKCTPFNAEIMDWLDQVKNKNFTDKKKWQIMLKSSGLSRSAFSVSIRKGILASDHGITLGAEYDPETANRVLCPQTKIGVELDDFSEEYRTSFYTFPENPFKKAQEDLCNILLINDFTDLKVQKMNINDPQRYAFNRKIGFAVYNAGLKALEKQLKIQLEQAERKKTKDLIYAIVEQIRNAYYWAMLRNPNQSENLVNEYKKQYKEYFKQIPIKKISKINDFSDPNLKFLFTSFKMEKGTDMGNDVITLGPKTYLNNKIDNTSLESKKEGLKLLGSHKKKLLDAVNIGIKVKDGITDNSCFAICGLAPLLIKGLVIDPRLDFLIMKGQQLNISQDWREGQEVNEVCYPKGENDKYILNGGQGELKEVADIAYSHFGYVPLEVCIDHNYGNQVLMYESESHPFLPIYLTTLQNGHYEILCRNVFELKAKEEMKERILKNNIPENQDKILIQRLMAAYNNAIQASSNSPKLTILRKFKQNLIDLLLERRDLINQINESAYQQKIIDNYLQGQYCDNPNTINYQEIIDELYALNLDFEENYSNISPKQHQHIKEALKKHEANENKIVTQDTIKLYKKISQIDENIQELVNSLTKDSYFKATPKNSIDPRLPLFSQAPLTFAYREFY